MRYLIWGTGYQANLVWQSNCDKFKDWDIEIVGFIDNKIDADKPFFHGIKVYSPPEIADLQYDYIDIWVIDEGLEQIKRQIKQELHIADEKIRNAFTDAIRIFSEPYRDRQQYVRPSVELFSAYVDYYRSHQWYKNAYRQFERQKRAWRVYDWINAALDKNCEIMDIACGGGELLYYLREAGFRNLHGFDIDRNSVLTAQDIDRVTQGDIHFFVDDATRPQFTGKYDVFVWMTGLHLLENYSLKSFLGEYVPKLNRNGYVIFEMVDAAYNYMPMNQFHTADWEITGGGLRRNSEYKIRMAKAEAVADAEDFGLELKAVYDVPSKIPFKIYFMQKTEQISNIPE